MFASLTLLVSMSVMAEPLVLDNAPGLGLPVSCKVGVDCWVVKYFDHGQDDLAMDHKCGKRTLPHHHGIDLAVRDEFEISQGRYVVAAADGVVKTTRDGVKDRYWTPQNAHLTRGRECGNRVALNHGNNWYTDYCHLRRGSILVKPGDKVQKGQPIAMIGMSGKSQFPHVHFTVYFGKKRLDPFTGTTKNKDCGIIVKSLWDKATQQQFNYQPTVISDVGIAGSKAMVEDVLKGWYRSNLLSNTVPALGVWTIIYGLEKGDQVSMELRDPFDTVVAQNTNTVKRDHARRYSFTGKRRQNALWPTGKYTATVTVIKSAGDAAEFTKTKSFTVKEFRP